MRAIGDQNKNTQKIKKQKQGQTIDIIYDQDQKTVYNLQ